MRKRRIVYTHASIQDRSDISEWLVSKASRDVARRFDRRIVGRIKGLQYGSERGTVRDDALQIRVIGILPTVAIAFTVEEDTVIIHRILHNGQNWESEDS